MGQTEAARPRAGARIAAERSAAHPTRPAPSASRDGRRGGNLPPPAADAARGRGGRGGRGRAGPARGLWPARRAAHPPAPPRSAGRGHLPVWWRPAAIRCRRRPRPRLGRPWPAHGLLPARRAAHLPTRPAPLAGGAGRRDGAPPPSAAGASRCRGGGEDLGGRRRPVPAGALRPPVLPRRSAGQRRWPARWGTTGAACTARGSSRLSVAELLAQLTGHWLRIQLLLMLAS